MAFRHKYDWMDDEELHPLELELKCFRFGWPPSKGGLGKFGHFKNVVRMCWPDPDEQPEAGKSPKPFGWHPWAERGARVLCEWKYPALLGCASSSKTELAGVWGLVNWMADPMNTLVLVTSTSLKDARRRIWGSIVERFNALPWLPGKLVDSEGIIRTVGDDGKLSDRCGIALLAGDRTKAKEAVSRMIGLKALRVFLIADELPDLSPAIKEAALGNLASNPEFQFVGLGNFSSIYDPLGDFAEPKNGWDSITVNDDEWETKLGYCIRFDGLKSPNILCGETRWPYLYNSKTLAGHKRDYGENTAGFWRFCRSFLAPVGIEDTIYSEADLLMGKVFDTQVVWVRDPVGVAGFDPSYSAGGDRSVAVTGLFGWAYGPNQKPLPTVLINGVYVLHEDASQKNVPRSHQIARQFLQLLRTLGIRVENAGMDVTSGGTVLADIVDNESGKFVHRTQFGGYASNLPVSGEVDAGDKKILAKDKYHNRVTELWFGGRDLVTNQQIKGITKDMGREMKSRRFIHVNRRIKVEEKSDMKARLGYSPDIWDAGCVLLDVCRRLGLVTVQVDAAVKPNDRRWNKACDAAQSVYENANYEAQEVEEFLAYDSV